jgi:GR25 family glycosyltransferase involved in LPS biosynthesis
MKLNIKNIFLTVLALYLLWFVFENLINHRNQENTKFVNNHLTVAVINLERSPHRMEKMRKMLDEYGFENISRINAIDGKKVSKKSDLPTYEGLPCLSIEDDTSHITQTACYLSHLKALRYAINESSTNWTLILEDDAVFYKNPRLTMKILKKYMTENTKDIVWLTFSTSAGYLVNRKGAQLFYDFLNQKSDFTRDFVKNYNQSCLHDWAMKKAFKFIPHDHDRTFIGQRDDDISDITGKTNQTYDTIISNIKKMVFAYNYY